jgi:ribosomal RNA assembly protein
MIDKIRIPKKRIHVLFEKKREIEEATNIKIEVADEITIEGNCIEVMNAKNIIKAIGRGFATDIAMELIDEKKNLCIISLPHDRKKLKRVKSRIIGTEGRSKKNIEKLTSTHISVYGRTVSIIGDYENVDIARGAIEKLIGGSPHSNVYMFIEKSLKNVNNYE